MGMKTVPLAVFVRPPEPGVAKTRLAPVLGETGAAELYGAFVQDTVRLCAAVEGGAVELWSADLSEPDARRGLERFGFPIHEQPRGDLGERISAALFQGVRDHGQAIVIGSDSPSLPTSLVTDATRALQTADLVLGPTHDGGYYLIGVRGEAPIFDRVRWSTPHALADTLAANRGRDVRLLSPWYDIDTAADLALLRFHLELDSALAPTTRTLLR